MNGEGFRNSMFNGFNRNDVTEFITGMSKEMNICKAECEGLKAEKTELLSKLNALTNEVSQLKRVNEEISSKYGDADNLKATIAAMQAKIDEDAKTIETFNRLKGRISVLEFEACKRAQEIESAAADKYERIMDRLVNIIGSLKSDYEDIRSGAQQTTAQLRGEISNIEQRIGFVSTVLDKTADGFNELDKYIKKADQDKENTGGCDIASKNF